MELLAGADVGLKKDRGEERVGKTTVEGGKLPSIGPAIATPLLGVKMPSHYTEN